MPIDLRGGELLRGERRWRDLYGWFKEQGYLLRPRYQPGWTPSWDKKDFRWQQNEDAQRLHDFRILDATRISDGAFVAMKHVPNNPNADEEAVAAMFSAEPLASDARNHCVPVYDWLTLPGEEGEYKLMVTPLLRKYGSPRFDTIGEVVAMWRQIFEGLHFMHIHNVAHRDCTNNNIMMDATPMYPEPFHPALPSKRRDWKGTAKHYTRTQRPPKYYLIDFGLSCIFRPEDEHPLELPVKGGDKTMPEFEGHYDDLYDPFPADVYYMGNWVREHFMQKYHGFAFMQPLVADMVQSDPTKRPTMEQVIARFDAIVKALWSWKLRSRVAARNENPIAGLYRSIGHWKRRVHSIASSLPPVPIPAVAPSNQALPPSASAGAFSS